MAVQMVVVHGPASQVHSRFGREVQTQTAVVTVFQRDTVVISLLSYRVVVVGQALSHFGCARAYLRCVVVVLCTVSCRRSEMSSGRIAHS